MEEDMLRRPQILDKNNEEQKPAAKELVKHTREFYDEEAKKDIQNLLSSFKNSNFSEEDEDYTELLNINPPRSNKIMERIDKILKNKKSIKAKQKNLRVNAQITAGNVRRGTQMQNSPLNLWNPIRSSSNLHNSDANNNQFLQQMNTLTPPNSDSVKSRISGGHNVNNLLRNSVNHVNIKPEVYPVLISEDKYGSREKFSEQNIQISDQYYANDEDELFKLANEVDTEHDNQPTIRTTTIPMTENFDLGELLNQLHIKRGEVIATRKESDNNVRLQDLLNKFYSQSTNQLRYANRVKNAPNHLDEFDDNIDSKYRDNSKTLFLSSDVVDYVNPNANERLDEFMKYLDIGKNLRISHDTLSNLPNGYRPVTQGDRRGRQRRSTNTQAGYSQDPDTCKTYNENLVKLWSNLSKRINVTEQPNDRALHNIALMIQAYLEHQNTKQPPQTRKAKHEGPRDKISEIMLKIKKLLEGSEGSAEKITNIIIKYLKPYYMDNETEDCQQVNEEYLGLSVNLLYKNYLENTDCEGEDDSMARNKKPSLREKKVKTGKALSSNGEMTLSLAADDLNPEIQTVLIENELYNDFHKGKIPRQSPTNKYRRVFKRSRRSRPAHRPGNENESENLQTRSKASPKSSSKKLKKGSLKSNLVKSKCEKYLTRKLIISLRPVMERFIGLLECQIDHTLRSVRFSKNSKKPYYVYASKFNSNEDSRHHRKISPSLSKNTGRKINKSHKKLHRTRHDSSVEHSRDVYERNDETDSEWARKYSFDQIKGMNSGTPAVARGTDARESDTENNKQHSNSDYLTTYNEYVQSPPLYDDYDGIYKKHQITDFNGFTSLKPSNFLNDKKNTRDNSTNQKVASSAKEQDNEKDKNDEYGFLEETFSKEPINEFNFDLLTESDIIEEPFMDLTKLKRDDQLIEEKSKVHVKSFESITDFLKRARDASLQTPEFAVPFALDTNKGYVELTHLIKYPKMLVYRPQFLVKNTMPYDDFLKTINNINMTNDDVRLMKIVRHLPDSSVQVLFETEDFEAPLEVRNLNDNRRSDSLDPLVSHQFESRMETYNENKNADSTDGDSEVFSPRNEARRKIVDALVKSDSLSNDEVLSPDFNPHLEMLRVKEEQSPNIYFNYNSDTKLTLNSKPNSSVSSSSLWLNPSQSFSGLFTQNPSSYPGQDGASAISSAADSQIGSGMQLGLDTALNLGYKFNPIHPSPLGSFFSKLIPSHSTTQSTSNPSLNSQSHINSHSDSSSGSLSASNSYSQLNSHSGSWLNSNSDSHSLIPYTDNSKKEVENNSSSSTKSIVLRWWRKWKNIVKGKMKQIIGKMASLTDKIDHIVKL